MTKLLRLAVIPLMKRRFDPTKLMSKAGKALNPKTPQMPEFKVGDVIKVHCRVTEGEKTRIQIFEGTVIAKFKGPQGGQFVVRKISYGVGVERIFQATSNVIEKVTLVSKGSVRRAKLYYLRDLSGRSARIKSDLVFGTEASGESVAAVAAAQETGDADGIKAQAAQA